MMAREKKDFLPHQLKRYIFEMFFKNKFLQLSELCQALL